MTKENHSYVIRIVMQQGGLERRMEMFRRKCREKGLALTHQREIIYRTMSSMENHPSPEAIFEVVREHVPSISLGTVYKNIRTFLDAGLLREVSQHHGSLRVETNLTPHHHLVCLECKAILDLDESDLDPVRLRRRPPAGFRIQQYCVEITGLCSVCAARSAGVRKPKQS